MLKNSTSKEKRRTKNFLKSVPLIVTTRWQAQFFRGNLVVPLPRGRGNPYLPSRNIKAYQNDRSNQKEPGPLQTVFRAHNMLCIVGERAGYHLPILSSRSFSCDVHEGAAIGQHIIIRIVMAAINHRRFFGQPLISFFLPWSRLCPRPQSEYGWEIDAADWIKSSLAAGTNDSIFHFSKRAPFEFLHPWEIKVVKNYYYYYYRHRKNEGIRKASTYDLFTNFKRIAVFLCPNSNKIRF